MEDITKLALSEGALGEGLRYSGVIEKENERPGTILRIQLGGCLDAFFD